MSTVHDPLRALPMSEWRGEVHYPCSDGEPMAEYTVQYEWIVTLKENLEALLPRDFVAADLFWYPVEGDNRTRRAPDVLVALGRPTGHRLSYLQWEEAGIAPQVVFEIWSPGNTFPAMVEKLRWYDRYGVEELYTYSPERNEFSAWVRGPSGELDAVGPLDGFRSPRLGISFHLGPERLEVRAPDGGRFLSVAELRRARDEAERRAEAASARAEAASSRAEALAAKLCALGIDPDDAPAG